MTPDDYESLSEQFPSSDSSNKPVDRKGQVRKRPDYIRKRGPVRKAVKSRRQRKIQW